MPQGSRSKIQFHYLERGFLFKERTELKKFLALLIKKEGRQLGSLDYIFCSDKYLLSINQSFLSHNYYTDIISFDLSESKMLIGEIYISIDRIRANSKIFDTSFREELQRVIFHGALHLCGYKDNNSQQKAHMRMKEDFYLALYRKH